MTEKEKQELCDAAAKLLGWHWGEWKETDETGFEWDAGWGWMKDDIIHDGEVFKQPVLGPDPCGFVQDSTILMSDWGVQLIFSHLEKQEEPFSLSYSPDKGYFFRMAFTDSGFHEKIHEAVIVGFVIESKADFMKG